MSVSLRPVLVDFEGMARDATGKDRRCGRHGLASIVAHRCKLLPSGRLGGWGGRKRRLGSIRAVVVGRRFAPLALGTLKFPFAAVLAAFLEPGTGTILPSLVTELQRNVISQDRREM